MIRPGVGIALPVISEEFSRDIPTVQWIYLAYVLTTASMFMPVGRLADIIGRRKVFLLGWVINMIGAAVGGFAPVFSIVVIGKVIQGIGVAGIQGNGMAIISSNFPESERGKSIGLYTAIIGSGLTSGPTIGGLLVHFVGWRAVFLANIPLGVIALFLALLAFKPMVPSSGATSQAGAISIGSVRRTVCRSVRWLPDGDEQRAQVRLGFSPPIISKLRSCRCCCFRAFIWWQLRNSPPDARS